MEEKDIQVLIGEEGMCAEFCTGKGCNHNRCSCSYQGDDWEHLRKATVEQTNEFWVTVRSEGEKALYAIEHNL